MWALMMSSRLLTSRIQGERALSVAIIKHPIYNFSTDLMEIREVIWEYIELRLWLKVLNGSYLLGLLPAICHY